MLTQGVFSVARSCGELWVRAVPGRELSPVSLSLRARSQQGPGAAQLWKRFTARSAPLVCGVLIVPLGLLLRALRVCMWPCETRGLLSRDVPAGEVQGFERSLRILGF